MVRVETPHLKKIQFTKNNKGGNYVKERKRFYID